MSDLYIDPAWRTPDVYALARAASADPDPALFKVLADALEEAGCPPDAACLFCSGQGRFTPSPSGDPTCRPCGGTGRIGHPLLTHLRGQDAGPCPTCKGVGTLTMNLTGARCQCRDCHGTGRIGHPLLTHLRGQDAGPCPTCKGKKMREVTSRPPLPQDPVPNLVGCTDCHGTGRVPAVHAKGCWATDLLLGYK